MRGCHMKVRDRRGPNDQKGPGVYRFALTYALAYENIAQDGNRVTSKRNKDRNELTFGGKF